MKNLVYSFLVLAIALLINSCVYDKGEIAQPDLACDTSYYTLQIKPIIDLNCALSGCHAPATANADFTTHAGMLKYLDNGDVKHRINADINDANLMPQGSQLPDSTLTILNEWIDAGYVGCD